MSKVVTSLVRILSKFVHIEQGYVIKVCLVSSYLFDYAHYFITSLGIFDSRNYYLCSHCNRNVSLGDLRSAAGLYRTRRRSLQLHTALRLPVCDRLMVIFSGTS